MLKIFNFFNCCSHDQYFQSDVENSSFSLSVSKFDTIDSNDNKNDLISVIPYEIFKIILLNLELADLSRCCLVSKTWRDKTQILIDLTKQQMEMSHHFYVSLKIQRLIEALLWESNEIVDFLDDKSKVSLEELFADLKNNKCNYTKDQIEEKNLKAKDYFKCLLSLNYKKDIKVWQKQLTGESVDFASFHKSIVKQAFIQLKKNNDSNFELLKIDWTVLDLLAMKKLKEDKRGSLLSIKEQHQILATIAFIEYFFFQNYKQNKLDEYKKKNLKIDESDMKGFDHSMRSGLLKRQLVCDYMTTHAFLINKEAYKSQIEILIKK